MKNKNIRSILLVFVLFALSGCGQTWWETLYERKNVLVITGRHTISGETLELKPGTIIKFKPVKGFSLAGEVILESGELVFENGAKLIARGTPSDPIIFTREEDEGILTFKENSDGKNTIIQYCEFREKTHIRTEASSLCIEYNKFRKTWTEYPIYQIKGSMLIKNNTFEGSNTTLIDCGGSGTRAEIIYNDIKNGYYGIDSAGELTVKYNNITNCDGFAISAPASSVIDTNYVANNNGKQGVDVTGEQSDHVAYTNPQTSPIPNADCGW